MLTIPDKQIGKSTFAVNIQAIPDRTSVKQLEKIQNNLVADLDFDIYCQPPLSLHMTVFPLIWARGSYASNPAQIWKNTEPLVMPSLKSILQNVQPIELKANCIKAFPSAIVIMFDTSNQINRLRDQIASLPPLGALGVTVPTISHITLFRFISKQKMGEIDFAVDHFSELPKQVRFSKILIREEHTYPTLKNSDVLDVDLQIATNKKGSLNE